MEHRSDRGSVGSGWSSRSPLRAPLAPCTAGGGGRKREQKLCPPSPAERPASDQWIGSVLGRDALRKQRVGVHTALDLGAPGFGEHFQLSAHRFSKVGAGSAPPPRGPGVQVTVKRDGRATPLRCRDFGAVVGDAVVTIMGAERRATFAGASRAGRRRCRGTVRRRLGGRASVRRRGCGSGRCFGRGRRRGGLGARIETSTGAQSARQKDGDQECEDSACPQPRTPQVRFRVEVSV